CAALALDPHGGNVRLAHDAVASAALRRIQRRVCSLQHAAHGVAAGVRSSHTDAGSDAPAVGKPTPRVDGHDAFTQPLGNLHRRIEHDAGQYDEEFFAAEAAKERRLDDTHAHPLSDDLEHLVAGHMPVVVVDALEVID